MHVDLPACAHVTMEADRRVVFFSDAPWLRVEIDPPVSPPDDPRVWTRTILEHARPAETVIRVLGSIRGRSPLGWPLQIVNLVAVRRDSALESRLVGLYEMLGHVAAVSIYATDRTQFIAAFQSVLLPTVASARPTWSRRSPVALSELWSLKVSRPND